MPHLAAPRLLLLGTALALAAPAHAQSPGPDGSRLRMQLGSHLGLGWQFTPASRIGLRFSHFSNPRIKKPHPGLNMLQLPTPICIEAAQPRPRRTCVHHWVKSPPCRCPHRRADFFCS